MSKICEVPFRDFGLSVAFVSTTCHGFFEAMLVTEDDVLGEEVFQIRFAEPETLQKFLRKAGRLSLRNFGISPSGLAKKLRRFNRPQY